MDTSCCSAAPRCKDEHVCDYYNNQITGKVRLGGIYDKQEQDLSAEDEGTVEEGASETDEEKLRQREQEQLTQCQEKAKKWTLDFMKRSCGDSPCAVSDTEDKQSSTNINNNKKREMQAATDRILEQFGGLTLGFSGPLPSASKVQEQQQQQQQQMYHGLHTSPRLMQPDYPDDLHMKKICKTKLRTSTQRRIWDDEDRPEFYEHSLLPTFSPQTSPSLAEVSDTDLGRKRTTTTMSSSTALRPTTGPSRTARAKQKPRQNMPVSADQMILKYIEKFNLSVMLEYFLALACLQGQDNPFLFISDVAGRMVRARDNEEEFHRLDRLFTEEHVAALFRLYDKEQHGFVSLQQYKTAMENLGLVAYNKEPVGHEIDKITPDVFVMQAMKALDLQLKSFLKVDKS